MKILAFFKMVEKAVTLWRLSYDMNLKNSELRHVCEDYVKLK